VQRIAVLGAAVLAMTVAMMAGTAYAHFGVKSTSPGKGATAATSLRAVKVTFTGPIRSGTLRVTGPGRKLVSVGSGGRDPSSIARVRVRLKGDLSAGRYKARWTAVAADGHEQSGSFRFRLRRR
jgi:methionine-rich copper-binding protein CopC